jgi:cytochrome c2
MLRVSSTPLILGLLLWTAGCSPGDTVVDYAGGNPRRGAELFVAKQCPTCHTLAAIPDATGTSGPNLNGIGTTAAMRKPGMAGAAYIRESIKDPNAYIVPGIRETMVLPVPVDDRELNDLVAFLMTQR